MTVLGSHGKMMYTAIAGGMCPVGTVACAACCSFWSAPKGDYARGQREDSKS